MFAGRMACRVPSETPSWGVRLPPRPWVGEAGAHPLPGTSSLMWPGPWVSIESHRLLVGLALRFTALFLLELFFSDQNAGGRCAPVWRQMVACDFRETQTRNTRRHGRLQVEGLWARCSFTSLGQDSAWHMAGTQLILTERMNESHLQQMRKSKNQRE